MVLFKTLSFYCLIVLPLSLFLLFPEPVRSQEGGGIVFDNRTCILTATCFQNATYCSFLGCCALKICDLDQRCYVDIPECILTGMPSTTEEEMIMINEEENDLNYNETCIADNSCRNNFTYCHSSECCASKLCFSDGFCAIEKSSCYDYPDENTLIFESELNKNNLEDGTCVGDPQCRRNATFCLYKGCCSIKTCDPLLCTTKITACTLPDLTMEQITDLYCLRDENCLRDVSVCFPEGCCLSKTCSASGECTQLTACKPSNQPTINNNISTDCVLDRTCLETSSFCYSEGCCVNKTCSADGLCSVEFPDCAVSVLSQEEKLSLVYANIGSPLTTDQSCIIDPECKQNAISCSRGGCCVIKTCDSDNSACIVTFPYC